MQNVSAPPLSRINAIRAKTLSSRERETEREGEREIEIERASLESSWKEREGALQGFELAKSTLANGPGLESSRAKNGIENKEVEVAAGQAFVCVLQW